MAESEDTPRKKSPITSTLIPPQKTQKNVKLRMNLDDDSELAKSDMSVIEEDFYMEETMVQDENQKKEFMKIMSQWFKNWENDQGSRYNREKDDRRSKKKV